MLGVLLGGGHGRRMGPFTQTVTNKHLAPVYSEKDGARPMIDYPIDTLKRMGITEILVITSQDHCGDIVGHLNDGYDLGLDITYKIQEMRDPTRPAGIASALKLAKNFTKDENFVVILGDNFFEWNESFNNVVFSVDNLDNLKCGLFLYKTDEWSRFGVADLDEPNKLGYRRIKRIVEKPKEYVSDLAVTGMYAYTPDVYQYLDKLTPSERGELEITDINNMYCEKGLTWYTKFDTFWSDTGEIQSMIKTQDFLNGNNIVTDHYY